MDLLTAPLWIFASLLLFSLQFGLVLLNAWVILLGLVAARATRAARRGLRWLSLPIFPGPRAAARKLAAAQAAMLAAESYKVWCSSASEVDKLTGADAWRNDRSSDEFNAQLIEDTMRRLREARLRGDHRALVFVLRTVMHRQYGGLDQPCLFRRALTGTKTLVEEYLAEVCCCLASVASGAEAEGGTPPLTPAQRVEFFEQCRLQVGQGAGEVALPQFSRRCPPSRRSASQVGRTALALSGGGSLAMAHMGVVRALLEGGLLPRVIAGTSGGSIIAGMVRREAAWCLASTHVCRTPIFTLLQMAFLTDEELLAEVLQPNIVER